MKKWETLAVGAVVVYCIEMWRRSASSDCDSDRSMHLVSDEEGNEALVVSAYLAGERSMFMIDTAYAGAPVLSSSFIGVQGKCAFGSVQHRYTRCLHLLRNEVPAGERHVAVWKHLLRYKKCHSYTSGCTMRLMGIGETNEAQADMLLCPALRLSGKAGFRAPSSSVDADIFVTNPLPGTPHILTSDYLLHRAPCVLCPRIGKLHLGAAVFDKVRERTFEFHTAAFLGGAFLVPMTVGGSSLQIVIDTGAAAALSLSASALEKLEVCDKPVRESKALQVGVNGEEVCSDLLLSNVKVGRIDLGQVHVFANSVDVQGADGYAGMGLLRALDLWLEPGRIGFRTSGLKTRAPISISDGNCGRPMPSCTRR